jgi:hypothetical protein
MPRKTRERCALELPRPDQPGAGVRVVSVAWHCTSTHPEQEAGCFASLSQVSNSKWASAEPPHRDLGNGRGQGVPAACVRRLPKGPDPISLRRAVLSIPSP